MKKSNKSLREANAKNQIRIANQGERKMWVKAPSTHKTRKGYYDRKEFRRETREILKESY